MQSPATAPERPDVTAYVGLGANLGDAAQAVRQAIGALAALPHSRLLAASSLYGSAPHQAEGPDFVNAVVALATRLTAPALLAELQRIEAAAGRERPFRHAPRTLDLDLIALGDEVWPDLEGQKDWMALDPARQRVEAPDRLILPHPRLQDRAFVLIPLADICPAWRHPVTGATVPDMIAALPEADKEAIWPV